MSNTLVKSIDALSVKAYTDGWPIRFTLKHSAWREDEMDLDAVQIPDLIYLLQWLQAELVRTGKMPS
jgi:hypothetical protein